MASIKLCLLKAPAGHVCPSRAVQLALSPGGSGPGRLPDLILPSQVFGWGICKLNQSQRKEEKTLLVATAPGSDGGGGAGDGSVQDGPGPQLRSQPVLRRKCCALPVPSGPHPLSSAAQECQWKGICLIYPAEIFLAARPQVRENLKIFQSGERKKPFGLDSCSQMAQDGNRGERRIL